MFNALLGSYVGALAESAHRKGERMTSATPIWNDECTLNQDAVTAVAMGTVVSEIYAKDPQLEQSDDELKKTIISRFRKLCNSIKGIKYTESLFHWLQSDSPQPFQSLGAGAALRAIGPAMLFDSLTPSLRLTRLCTEITHNHFQGINGALAMAVLLKWLHFKLDISDIKEYMIKLFSYDMDKEYAEWKRRPPVKATCMECIPAAVASLEAANSFDDAIRNALAMNGPRIIAALTGALAMTFYGKKDAGLSWIVAVLKSINSKETKELCQGIIDIPTLKNEEYKKSEADFTRKQLLGAIDLKISLDDTLPFMEK